MQSTIPTRVALAALVLTLPAGAGDPVPGGAGDGWPQWRGPARDGVSKENAWVCDAKPEPLWEARVGMGYGAVSIAGGRLYTTGYDREAGLDLVFCLDALSGEELWSQTYPAEIWNELHEGGTLTTPSIDGDSVYVLNREGLLSCFAAEDGEILWQRHVVEELGVKPPRWGFAASPLVLPDKLVLNLGRVFALDKASGEVLWKSERDSGPAYGTPVDFEHGGKAALAVFNGDGFVALELAGGAELGFHARTNQYRMQCATPVLTERGIFVSASDPRGGIMIALDEEAPKVVWEQKTMRNKMTGCVLIGEHLYGFDESILKCMDLDGNEVWRQRGMGDGCLSGAGDRLLCMTSKGELVIAEATPEEYRELSRTKVLDGGVYWTTPVLNDGLIYCRNSEGDLVCLDHRPE